jgi:SNF2 family DNA or RNA helicase
MYLKNNDQKPLLSVEEFQDQPLLTTLHEATHHGYVILYAQLTGDLKEWQLKIHAFLDYGVLKESRKNLLYTSLSKVYATVKGEPLVERFQEIGFPSLILPPEYPPFSDSPRVQPQDLLPLLLPYQKRAVSWMLQREGVSLDHLGHVIVSTPEEQQTSPRLWKGFIKNGNDYSLYINTLNGELSPEIPEESGTAIQGGVLADEMGVGKTVMMLALVLHHKPSSTSMPSLKEFKSYTQDSYYLDKAPTQNLVVSNGTLIVTPQSILFQWISEINRHAPSLSHFIFQAGMDMDPVELAKYDIVFTTYGDLTKEVHASEPLGDRVLRHKSKYQRRISTLTSIIWWRGEIFFLIMKVFIS